MTESTTGKPILLVVDDSRLMRVAARKILKEDFDILEAGDGEQAWESLQANPRINLVMSDLSMPNLDGLGLLKRIREAEQDYVRTLPVIIVTGAEDDDGSRQTALSAGASDFITKPFESIQLLARAKAQAKQQCTQEALVNSEASKQQLEQLNPVDLLTGLANARGFTNAMEESLSYARRHRTELALLLLRVDKYKVMFLRNGKQTAEDILQRLARLLCEGRRREDIAARTELDTFGLLLPSANAIGARRVAEQILETIRNQHFESGAETLHVTVSIASVAPLITPDTTAAELLATARERLQQAADAGGDCVQHDITDAAAVTVPVAAQEPAPPVPAAGTPAVPVVATATDLQQALQALAAGRQPETDASALVRAILPLLHAWSQTHGERCNALINEMETILAAETPTDTAVPADIF